ncbi:MULTISPECIES: ABC transporter permease subunit [unclassified Aminobacter]|uniref:ABC transporter permease n=1 Tax=unclassified Aminobacter TaxID=2644704 RepID=UPI0004650A4F|nr:MULTISPECIES: ABC transporter permease subunit [unclassified Aminobacter]TWH24008.1 NitT/TauT family transport system permease protein [Aminobacter sp. J15]
MSLLRGLAIPAALILLWQGLAMWHDLQSDTLAAPREIILALGAALTGSTIWKDTADTFAAGGLGLALGFGLGAATGVLFGILPPLSRLMRVTVELLRPLPSISIVPIALLIFGFGYSLEIAIVAFATYFPVLVLTENAVRQIEPRLWEVARALDLSFAARVIKIVVPAVVPRLFVALRLAAGIALIVAITVEIAANPMGLGARLMQASASLRPADMFATLFWVAYLGWLLNWVMLRLQGLLFPATRGAPR